MKTVISRFTSTRTNLTETAKLVECNRQVFADPPWNEWQSCPVCQKSWGQEEAAELVATNFCHCGVPTVDYWSRNQVANDLEHEITGNTSCWLASINDSVIGFCWGYEISVNSLEQKLEIEFAGELKSRFGQTRIAYQDEVGVVGQYRRHGIANDLVSHRLKDFLSQGLEVGIVRTREHPEPSHTCAWYQRLGYEVVARYPGDDGRIIMAGYLPDTLKFF